MAPVCSSVGRFLKVKLTIKGLMLWLLSYFFYHTLYSINKNSLYIYLIN